MKLQYQLDAVMQAKQKIDAYGGVFISDVVGLGKTYICAMLANTFNRNTYKLFVCPPVLCDYWRSVLQEFDVARCDVVSLAKVINVIEQHIVCIGKPDHCSADAPIYLTFIPHNAIIYLLILTITRKETIQ